MKAKEQAGNFKLLGIPSIKSLKYQVSISSFGSAEFGGEGAGFFDFISPNPNPQTRVPVDILSEASIITMIRAKAIK